MGFYEIVFLCSTLKLGTRRRGDHGLNKYKDTKALISSLLMFNRVIDGDTVSHVGILEPSCELAPL